MTGEFVMYTVHTAINRQGTLFLWPIRLPGPDGKQSDWARSAHEGAAHATKNWVRITANTNLGAYEIRVAAGSMQTPNGPSTVSVTCFMPHSRTGLLIEPIIR